MERYYIVQVQGPFKQYYSESSQDNILKKQPGFTAMLRYAKPFNTIEEADKIIEEKVLENSHVITDSGIKVK